MANYATLKAAINAVIKTNGNKEITGQVLNQTLMAIVDSLGGNYQFAGVAVPSTNPGTPDQNIFYLATQAGTYTNFGAIVLPAGISFLEWNGSWSSETLFTIDDTPTEGSGNLVRSGGVKTAIDNIAFSTGEKVKDVVITDTLASGSDSIITSGAVFDAFKNDGGAYDVSVHFPTGGVEGGNTYTLDGAIAMVPQNMRKGGMSIKFVSTSDNKYVQFRYMGSSTADADFINIANWQGVDKVPTPNSKNFVESGGIANFMAKTITNIAFEDAGIEVGGMVIDGDTITFDSTKTNYRTFGRSSNKRIHLNAGDIIYLSNWGTPTIGAIYSAFTKVTTTGGVDSYECLVQGKGTAQYFYKAEEEMNIIVCSQGSRMDIMTLEVAASENNVESKKAETIVGWLLAESFTIVNATYTDGVINSPVSVVWPDTTTGTLAITRDDNGLVTSITIGYGVDSYIYTITRDDDGNATNSTIVKQ